MFPITYTSHAQNIILEVFTSVMWEFTFAYLGPDSEALRSTEYIREASASSFGTVLFSTPSYLLLNFKHASWLLNYKLLEGRESIYEISQYLQVTSIAFCTHRELKNKSMNVCCDFNYVKLCKCTKICKLLSVNVEELST